MPKFRPPLWVLAWFALLLLAGVIFLANVSAVDRLMDATGLTAVLYPDGKALKTPTPRVDEPLVDTAPSPTPVAEAPAAETTSDEAPAEVATHDPSTTPSTNPDTPVADPTPTVAETPVGSPGPNAFQLYFSRLGPDGRMETAAWYRELPAGMTPLTATLRALLLGPTLQEKSQGALTLMPPGTKLLSVRVKDKTALVSFSEEFTHNAAGNEGLVGQLKQVVWTATQFSTVDAVQVLIAGQYRDTLGEGGVSIAQPLTRALLP